MRVITHFRLLPGINNLEVPEGTEILTFIQSDIYIHMKVLIPTGISEPKKVPMIIKVLTGGMTVSDSGEYIGYVKGHANHYFVFKSKIENHE